MEEIIAALFRGIAQGIGYFIGEVLFKYVFHYSGAVFFKAVTFGNYPKAIDDDPFGSFSGIFLTCVGASIWVGATVFVAINYLS